MVINLKDKTALIPRNEKGDPGFGLLGLPKVTNAEIQEERAKIDAHPEDESNMVLEVFTAAEVVELVNRALYQIEYQKTSHRKRGQKLRDVEKALKEELKKQGLDVKVTEIKNQLEGKK